ncbi:hypothetical protein LCGC14_0359550 [marine sediment metagenome]|uniref:Uncharacterized protein n=1 Tax=marine sediment metagenome TaxID=412755 RepID=A0A0F9T8H8_9ZZZZ|nr:hypothetical protein [Candidatus Aminicenantes bacterium]
MGKGGGGGGSDNISRESLDLQKEMFEFQKEQVKLAKQGRESEEAKLAAQAELTTRLNRQGRQSTIKTIKKRESFDIFFEQFKKDQPLDIPDSVPVDQALQDKFRSDITTELGAEFDARLDNRGSGYVFRGNNPSKRLIVDSSGKLITQTKNAELGGFDELSRGSSLATKDLFISRNIESRTSSAISTATTAEDRRRKEAEKLQLQSGRKAHGEQKPFERLITSPARVRQAGFLRRNI